MEAFYVLVFGALAAAAALFELTKPKEGQMSTSRDFLRFRTNYIVVYSLMMGRHSLLSDLEIVRGAENHASVETTSSGWQISLQRFLKPSDRSCYPCWHACRTALFCSVQLCWRSWGATGEPDGPNSCSRVAVLRSRLRYKDEKLIQVSLSILQRGLLTADRPYWPIAGLTSSH